MTEAPTTPHSDPTEVVAEIIPTDVAAEIIPTVQGGALQIRPVVTSPAAYAGNDPNLVDWGRAAAKKFAARFAATNADTYARRVLSRPLSGQGPLRLRHDMAGRVIEVALLSEHPLPPRDDWDKQAVQAVLIGVLQHTGPHEGTVFGVSEE